MKIYIEDFEFDLNYAKIVLYIGGLNENEKKLLEKQCKEDYLNKEYRWEYIENGSKFFYVENCDIQDCNGIELLNCIEDSYKFYLLEHDEKGFYYEVREDYSFDKEYNNLQKDYFRIKASYENLKIDFKMLVEVNNKYFNGIQEVIKILKNDPEYEKIGSHEAKRKLIELVGVESL